MAQGGFFSYTFMSRAKGGTGKPYVWTLSGALPSSLLFNSKTAKLSGVVASTASISAYPLKICVTGGKKGSIPKTRNSICKTTKLIVVAGVPASKTATGTYVGNINYPNLNPAGSTGCEAKVILRSVTLVEGAGGAITGTTNHEKMATLAGTRIGSEITATLQSSWGPRGPYVWQWDGATISGTLPAFCWDLSTGVKLNESSYTFTLQRS